MNLVILFYFLLSSIKTLIFGSTHMLNTSLHDYSQYSILNLDLLKINNTNVETTISSLKWIFFGMSPGETDRHLIFKLNKLINNEDTKVRDVREVLNNTITERDKLIEWFEDNRFGIAVSSMMIFIALIIFGHFILNTFKKQKINNILSHGIVTGDGSIASIKPNYWNSSYINLIISVLLLSYCNITTVTIYELINLNKISVAYGLFTFGILILYVLLFPIAIFRFLLDKNNNIYDRKIMDNFGALYLSFKPKNRRFMCIIILKQICYAIVINIDNNFGYLQNSLLLFVNGIYLGLLIYYHPYTSQRYNLQSIILTLSLIIVSLINYYTISANGNASFVWFLSILVIQTISLILYFTITLKELIDKYNMNSIILAYQVKSNLDEDNEHKTLISDEIETFQNDILLNE